MQKNYKIATTLLMKIYSYDKLSNTKSLTLVYTDEVSMCHYDKGASPALAVLRNMVYTVEIQIISTTNIRNSWENKTKQKNRKFILMKSETPAHHLARYIQRRGDFICV